MRSRAAPHHPPVIKSTILRWMTIRARAYLSIHPSKYLSARRGRKWWRSGRGGDARRRKEPCQNKRGTSSLQHKTAAEQAWKLAPSNSSSVCVWGKNRRTFPPVCNPAERVFLDEDSPLRFFHTVKCCHWRLPHVVFFIQ